MKHMRGFLIILSISFVGELLNELIPLPVPASIYGLVLMLLSLMTGIVKLESVQAPGRFLIDIMPLMFIPSAAALMDKWTILKPLMFIPSAAALMDKWTILKPLILPVVVISVVSTFVVMVVTGRTAQSVVRRDGRKREQ